MSTTWFIESVYPCVQSNTLTRELHAWSKIPEVFDILHENEDEIVLT
jgi:hypothetical protein